MSASRCLSSEELRDFVLGQTDESRSEEILAHLSECPACEDTIATFDDTADSLVVSVRQAAEPHTGAESSDASASAPSDPLAAALASLRSRFAPSSAAPPTDGSVSRIIERVRDYELLDELGSGGMGTVYKALHTKLDRTVALKLLPARRLRDQAAVARFEREMKAIGRLDHPAIVRATDAGEVDGTHFLAMDFVDGIDLGKLVRLVGPLDIPSACELIRQAAIGLQYAHDQGLIHRDVKPSNLMAERNVGTRKSDVGESNREQNSGFRVPNSDFAISSSTVRILDLGLALFGSASEAVDELTTVGQLMGTLDYMAPEQADNSHSVDARADVYSLGVTLFKLLTGMAPYETGERCSPLQKMKALATTDPPPITSRRKELPDGLAAIVDRMLLRDPDERFQSAAEVAEALMPFCNGQAIDDLVEHGMRLAEQHRLSAQSSHLAPRDEPIGLRALSNLPAPGAGPSSEPSAASGSAHRTSQNGSSRGARWLLWTVLTAVALFAGITIWLQTDTGTLKIECVDENVPIEIRSDSGKVVQKETLSVGQNEIVIHSGRYEIVLPQKYDELKIENGTYELTRGGEWIARVTKQPGSTTSPGVAGASGRSAFGAMMGEMQPTQPTRRSYVLSPSPQSSTLRTLDGGDLVDIYVDRKSPNRTQPTDVRELVAEVVPVTTIMQSGLRATVTVLVTPEEEASLRLAAKVGTFSIVLRAPDAKPLADAAIRRFDPEATSKQIELDAANTARSSAAVGQNSSDLQTPGRQSPTGQNDLWPLGSRLPGERKASTPPASTPVFSGRTFEEWQQSVLTERNPDELKSAVMALCILGRQNRDQEAAETVLKVTDAYPCEVSSSPEGELVAAAIRYLRTLDADAIVPAIVEALKSRGTNTRRLIVEHLASGVMYGNGLGGRNQGSDVPSTGQADPLMSRIRKSPEFRKALIELYPKLKPQDAQAATLRSVAFGIVENFLDDPTLKTEIDALLEHIFQDAQTAAQPGSSVTRAIVHLARRKPRAELADYFLNDIQRHVLFPNEAVAQSVSWLSSLKADWYGLWLLGDKVSPEDSNQIAKLLTAELPDTFCPSPLQADSLPVDPSHWGIQSAPRQTVTRGLLVLDLLGSIGPGAKSTLPAIHDEIERLTGQRPVDGGDFGYEANDPRTIYEQYAMSFRSGLDGTIAGGSGGMGGMSGGGFFSVKDEPDAKERMPVVMPESLARLNAALRAVKAITGQTPRFASHPLQIKEPAVGMGGADYSGGGGAPYGGGYPGMMGSPAVASIDPSALPQLVSYRNRGLNEWVTNKDFNTKSAEQLADVMLAVELLGSNEAGGQAAASIFDAVVHHDEDLTDTQRQLLRRSFIHSWMLTSGRSHDRLIQSMFSGSPVRLAAVLKEFAAPLFDQSVGEPPLNLSVALPNEESEELVNAASFQSDYRSLVERWEQLEPDVRSAILQLEAQLPTLGQPCSDGLLEQLLTNGKPQEKVAAALIVARMFGAQQPLIRKPLTWREAEVTQIQERRSPLHGTAIDVLIEAIRQRTLDVDWVNAVPAIVILSNGRLDPQVAREFTALIVEDSSEAGSVAGFGLLLPVPVVPATVYGMEGAGPGGLPGMPAGHLSGGRANAMSSGIPGGLPVGTDGSTARSYLLSRRILLCSALSFAAHNDATVRLEIARQIAAVIPEGDPRNASQPSDGFSTVLLHWQDGSTIHGRTPVKPGGEPLEFVRVARATLNSLLPANEVQQLLKMPSDGTALQSNGVPSDPSSRPENTGATGTASETSTTYKGRTYADWLNEVRRERSPEELSDSLQALVTLGAGRHDEEIARQILLIVSRLNVVASDGGSDGPLLAATARCLNQLKTSIVVPLVTEAVRSGQPHMVWYVTQRLMPDLDMRKWNSAQTRTTNPVSLALYENTDFRDALLSTWPEVTSKMRPQFVLAASLFADEAPPDGELPDGKLLRFLADVAGSDDAETGMPLHRGDERSSLKLHACRALAQIYPSCPELPKWTMDGLEPRRKRIGPQWWQHSENGWLALKQMGQNASGQVDRLVQWIADADEDDRRTFAVRWVSKSATGTRESHGIAVPRRLVMLEILAAIADRDHLSDGTRTLLATLLNTVPQFAAKALENSQGVELADTDYAREVATSAIDTLARMRDPMASFNFETFGDGLRTRDVAWLIVAHRRCRKLIAELLGDLKADDAKTEPESKPDE
ncbi:protein kinase [bacterium]|nr:protein kinase [bacterium]